MKPRLILAGAGHAHLAVLRDLAARPWPEADIVLVNPYTHTTYSGMAPGWLAGQYRWDELNLDIVALAARAGVELMPTRLKKIHALTRNIELQDGRTLAYDRLSLNLGSGIQRPAQAGGLSIRPLHEFSAQWSIWCSEAVRLPQGTLQRVAVVGSGAAGIEVLLAISHHLPRLAPQVNWQWHLVSRSPVVLPGWTSGTRRRVLAKLAQRNVSLHLGMTAGKISGHTFHDTQGLPLPMDKVLWCSGAAAPGWLADSGLALDERGFVQVDETLRSVSHPEVYAAGDCAAFPRFLQKSGVYAVRQGTTLTQNLRAALGDGTPRPYRPQRRTLALLNTGDGCAIGQWGPFGTSGAWLMRWKDSIDRRFIRRHSITPVPSQTCAGDHHA
jgi:pyridine nucleotide-disulfide oxidoreductase family protein